MRIEGIRNTVEVNDVDVDVGKHQKNHALRRSKRRLNALQRGSTQLPEMVNPDSYRARSVAPVKKASMSAH